MIQFTLLFEKLFPEKQLKFTFNFWKMIFPINFMFQQIFKLIFLNFTRLYLKTKVPWICVLFINSQILLYRITKKIID